MQFTTITGLIIRVIPQSDSNKILKIATENGAISAICYNCSKTKSQLVFLNEPFVFAEFQLKSGKGELLHINSANLIKNFYNLRLSLEKLEVAAEICRIIEKTIFENEPFPLSFVLNTFSILENAIEEKTKIILPLFTLRYLKEIGFHDETDNEIINFAQNAPLNKLYNVEIQSNTLKSLIKYTQTALKKI